MLRATFRNPKPAHTSATKKPAAGYDALKRLACLRKRALQCFLDVFFLIVGRQREGDEWPVTLICGGVASIRGSIFPSSHMPDSQSFG